MAYENSNITTPYGEKKLTPGPILEPDSSIGGFEIKDTGRVSFICKKCNSWIYDVTPSDLEAIKSKYHHLLKDCCYLYELSKEVEKESLRNRLELIEFYNRSKDEEKRRNWNGIIFSILLFGTLPMFIGTLLKDYSIALEGASFIVVVLICIGAWLWFNR